MTGSRTKMIAAAMVSLGCATADIVSAGPLSICAEHISASDGLNVALSNGCVSSSIRYLGEDLAVSVDQERAVINVTGGFNYKPLAPGAIVTTDCGGGRRTEVAVPGVGERRYYVMHNDNYVGIIDLTENSGRVCARQVPAGFGQRPVFMGANWRSVDYSGWERKSAPTLLGVLAPLYAWHPESLEGRPEMTIKMAPWAGRDAMEVQITMTGFLDDSVSGERFVALVESGGEGWTIGGLWKRNLCSRGTNAGKWVARNCS